LGLAIDIRKDDGARQLLVPNVKAAEALDFRQFWMAYEDVVRKARTGKLTVEDFAGTTISLTNPGTIGTEHSVPLRIINALLLGEQEFYDNIFQALRIPYEPVRWVQDIPAGHEDDISKAARVHEL